MSALKFIFYSKNEYCLKNYNFKMDYIISLFYSELHLGHVSTSSYESYFTQVQKTQTYS